jgi:hypothetical protein
MGDKGEIESKGGQKARSPLSSATRGRAKMSKAEKNINIRDLESASLVEF